MPVFLWRARLFLRSFFLRVAVVAARVPALLEGVFNLRAPPLAPTRYGEGVIGNSAVLKLGCAHLILRCARTIGGEVLQWGSEINSQQLSGISRILPLASSRTGETPVLLLRMGRDSIVDALSLRGQTLGLPFSEKERFACGIAKSWARLPKGAPSAFRPFLNLIVEGLRPS